MYEMKNTLNEINIRLDIPERKKKKDWRILRHSNRNREKTIKKLNRVAVCCETSRSLITCNQSPGGSAKKQKIFLRNNGQNFSKFDENRKPMDQRGSAISKHKKHEEIYTKVIIALLKTSDKEKMLKAAKETNTSRKTKIKMTDFSSESTTKKTVKQHHSSSENKQTKYCEPTILSPQIFLLK